MTVRIRYMGAKHALAPIVAQCVRALPEGPFLDLFAGMCSVAGSVAASGREVWCNDVQRYATEVASALVCSPDETPALSDTRVALYRRYQGNRTHLRRRFRAALRQEEAALEHTAGGLYAAQFTSWSHVGNSAVRNAERSKLAAAQQTFPYRLATLTYAYGYFGLAQAIDLDSVRWAIDSALQDALLSESAARWLRVSLLQAASTISSSPGHFAQYLSAARETAYQRIRRCRKRDVWAQFLDGLRTLRPYGTTAWRNRNRVYEMDALELAEGLEKLRHKPAVVYADPPYSKDQYSRYYHVLETLTRYDYPEAFGVGRYRPDRFVTPFSQRRLICQAVERLAAGVARAGAALVVSYPSDGVLFRAGGSMDAILRSYYKRVSCIDIAHRHSTLGGAHGRANTAVTENLYVATNPRDV